MASDIWSLLLTVWVPVFGAILAYALNERAKRREFEREKKYDLKRETYAEILSSIRSVHEVMTSALVIREIDKDFPNARPEEKGKLAEIKDLVAESTAFYLRHLADTSISSIVPEESNPKGFTREIVFIMRAERDFGNAISMLTLMNASSSILEKAESLFNEAMVKTELIEEKEDGFEHELESLRNMMRNDLQRTIRS